MKRLFLLDAYSIIYRSYYAFIKSPRINSKGINTSAILGFVNTLEEVINKEKPDYIAIAFDPKGGSFRSDLYQPYKAQREETPEVIKESIPIIKEIISSYNIPFFEITGYEADDVIGTITKLVYPMEDITTYMLTPDKDYCQLITDRCYIYKPKFGEKGYEVITPLQVRERYNIDDPLQIIDLLGLMGDKSDNVPGCPGVGEKRAQQLLSTYGSVENLIAKADTIQGTLRDKIINNTDTILLSKQLVTIKTDIPISFNISALERKSPNLKSLQTLFEELEFRTLLKRVVEREKNLIVTSPRPVVDNDGFSGDLFDIFPSDGQEERKYSNLKNINSTPNNYYIVDNLSDMQELTNKILAQKFCGFKLHVKGNNPIEAQILGCAISLCKNSSCYIPLDGKENQSSEMMQIIKGIIENCNVKKVGHNLKYDILVLMRNNIDIQGEIFDIMVAHYLVQPEIQHSFQYLSEVLLNYQSIPYEDIKESDPTHYLCEHADLSLQMWKILEHELEKYNMTSLSREIEMPLVKVLAYMENNGVRIDVKSLQATASNLRERMAVLEKRIYKLANREFNILSPKQVGEVLFNEMKIVDKAKRTKNGQYVTSEEILESLRHANPIVDYILNYRGLKKLLGTYVESLPQLINKSTGKIHTSFNQTITATGRLSSSNPNLQNIPIRDDDGKEVRRAFIPDNNSLLLSADYSQIELRLMAHLCGDENMVSDFLKGCDIHTATAAKIFGKSIDQVTKEERSKAKTANFGIIYGITVYGLAERMRVSRGVAKELIENYFKTYPAIKDYMAQSVAKAQRDEYIETILHRRRYIRNIHSTNSIVRGYAERNAINAPIQGSAADVIKRAMVRIYDRFCQDRLKSTMILQVHDELVFNVHINELEQVKRIVIEEMQGVYPTTVPLIAESGVGSNWLEAH